MCLTFLGNLLAFIHLYTVSRVTSAILANSAIVNVVLSMPQTYKRIFDMQYIGIKIKVIYFFWYVLEYCRTFIHLYYTNGITL